VANSVDDYDTAFNIELYAIVSNTQAIGRAEALEPLDIPFQSTSERVDAPGDAISFPSGNLLQLP